MENNVAVISALDQLHEIPNRIRSYVGPHLELGLTKLGDHDNILVFPAANSRVGVIFVGFPLRVLCRGIEGYYRWVHHRLEHQSRSCRLSIVKQLDIEHFGSL